MRVFAVNFFLSRKYLVVIDFMKFQKGVSTIGVDHRRYCLSYETIRSNKNR